MAGYVTKCWCEPNAKPHCTTPENGVFATVRRTPPWLLLAASLPKIKLHNPPSSPTGHQDLTQNAVVCRCPSPLFSTAQAFLPHTSVFFSQATPLGFFWPYLRQKSSHITHPQAQLGVKTRCKMLSRAVAHLPCSQQHRYPFHTLLFCFYHAIIITEVDDDGMEILLHNHPDSGRRCRGSGRGIGGAGSHSGREEWPQSDRHS